MPDIKVRDTVKGTIKAIDKSAVASERMKNAYVRTKEKAEHSIHAAEGSPEEYAADRLSGGMETAAYGAVHEADKTGRKAVRHVKDRISQHGESAAERKAELPKKQAAKRAETKAANRAANRAENTVGKVQALPSEKKGWIGQNATTPMQKTPCAPKADSPKGTASASPIKTTGRHPLAIRTREAEAKTVKQTAKSSGKAAIKTPNSGIKTTRRSVKTADRSGHAAIKTADRSANRHRRRQRPPLKPRKRLRRKPRSRRRKRRRRRNEPQSSRQRLQERS